MIGTRADTRHYIVSVFISLKKALDTADQSILCEKSRHHGRGGQRAAGEPQAALCLASCGSCTPIEECFLICVNFT